MLLSFAVEYEHESGLSLAVSANLLRVLGAAVHALRHALEPLATGPEGEPPPLFGGLEPYPDNWRASVRPPAILPHYPMVLHRGGYPDGS